jgi:phosphoribosylaminoimidazolecarboxamide formyltransferase/IMP cyclohydrolase
MNPCGVGVGATILEAYEKAYEADATSIFGGIIALNREVDKATAERLHEIFLEIIIARGFTDEAVEVLTIKKHLRLLTIDFDAVKKPERKLTSIEGGLLIQDRDAHSLKDAEIKVATKREPTPEEWKAMELGWKIVKHVKSNAIVVSTVKHIKKLAQGDNRSVKNCLEQAGERATEARWHQMPFPNG